MQGNQLNFSSMNVSQSPIDYNFTMDSVLVGGESFFAHDFISESATDYFDTSFIEEGLNLFDWL
ncbi:hypothetical protein ACI2OX_03665 [Bacillus sp. N9]